MKDSTANEFDYRGRFTRSNRHFLYWILVWVGTMLFADKAALYHWYASTEITLLVIAINAILGIGMILSFTRLLRNMDELQRKIQLDSLAMSVGVGLVGSFTYSLLVTWNIVIDAEISDIILLITATYSASIVFNTLRYR